MLNPENDMLEALMCVAINGPDVSQSQSLIHEVAKQWLAKPRQHLAIIPVRGKLLPVQVTTTADASVQVHTERLNMMTAWEVAAALVKNVE